MTDKNNGNGNPIAPNKPESISIPSHKGRPLVVQDGEKVNIQLDVLCNMLSEMINTNLILIESMKELDQRMKAGKSKGGIILP